MSDDTKVGLPPPPPVRTASQPQSQTRPAKKQSRMMGKAIYRALTNIDAGTTYYKMGEEIPHPDELDPKGKLEEGVHYKKDVLHYVEEEGT